MFDLRELICSDGIVLDPDETIGTTVAFMLDSGKTSLPVVNDRMELLGVVTEKLLLQWFCNGQDRNEPVKKCMEVNVAAISADTGMIAVMYRVVREKLREVPVVSNGKFIGVLKRTDVINHLLKLKKEKAMAIR